MGEKELLADGGEQEVGLLIDLHWLHDFWCRPSETIEIVADVKVERRGVFCCFYGLAFVVVDAAFQAFEVSGEAMLTAIGFSHFWHFSIKIIK